MALDYQDSGLFNVDSGGMDQYPDWVSQNEQVQSTGNVDFGSGWASTFQGLLGIGAKTWQQQTLMQQNQQGQRYIEGQRLALLQSKGLNSGTLLVIGGIALVYMLMKD